MNKQALAGCLDMIEAMQTGREQEGKWDSARKLYVLALASLTDEEGTRAVTHAALHDQWRPSPARLLEIAAEQASPIPDVESVYGEIARKVQTEGLYARPHPDRPSIKLEGPPPFSHPIVEKIVHYCGGWPMVCNGESNYSEGLKKQVRGAHESVASDWREKVKAQLMVPPEQRDRRYFPTWKPFVLPSDWTPDYQLPAIEPPRFRETQATELPASIRSQIAAIAAKRMLPPPSAPDRIPGKPRTSKASDLTPEDRRRIAEELKSHANAPDTTQTKSDAA